VIAEKANNLGFLLAYKENMFHTEPIIALALGTEVAGLKHKLALLDNHIHHT
jgi:hypothetical protein